MASTVNVYPLDTYKIGKKDAPSKKVMAQIDQVSLRGEDDSTTSRMARHAAKYEEEGLRRSVEGVLLVHLHKHPHVLLLQMGNNYFKLPGGRIEPGEEEGEGLLRKLTGKIAPASGEAPAWEVGELLATWWRPNFDNALYPYLPTHITKPKECKKIFLVRLPEKCTFAVPKQKNLVAVPLFDLYENHQRYGPVIASVPHMLARLNTTFS